MDMNSNHDTESATMEWTRSDRLAAPLERVWQLTIDVERWPEFLPTVTDVTRLDPDPFGPGSRVSIAQPGLTAEWTVEIVVPEQRLVWSTEWRGRRLVAEHLLESCDDGTRNTLRLRLFGGRSRLLGAVLGPLMRSTLAREARAFRRAAERPPVLLTAAEMPSRAGTSMSDRPEHAGRAAASMRS